MDDARAPGQSGHPNRLIQEKSPYLLQHARNPVDWYPWGDEAFTKAREEQKPVFLSIGYSTCHWCHVMERESFEDPEIASLLNRWFVAIKVDREEHPDVDQVYMKAVTAMSGQGGWPLTVFLTPDLKPFFGGTYFPPRRRGSVPGMADVLPAVADAWQRRRNELDASAQRLTQALEERLAPQAAGAVSDALLHEAFRQAQAGFDSVDGGFGGAPKFPRSHELSLLLRYWARTGRAEALAMVRTTLDALQRGGIHDQLGGGFHRYSTDERWLVPHFEKMLYDQALLARTYLEAYRITRDPAYAETARGIFGYVLRDLRDPEGGFYSAEDADSEGEEGKCYVWTKAELDAALGPEAELAARVYGVAPEGNFEHGRSILHLPQALPAAAQAAGLDEAALRSRLADIRSTLLATRARRVRPHRDDKILASWNGLMIGALAYGAATLDEPAYLKAAGQAADFVLQRMVRDGVLLRRFRDGDARYAGTLEDYAFLCDGLLELYEAGFDPRRLAQAAELAGRMRKRFWDEQDGGFFLRGKDEEPLIVRAKELYDGATPSGNSVALLVLLRLAHLTGDQKPAKLAQQALERFAPAAAQAPAACPHFLAAVDMALGPVKEIVIAGAPAAADTQALLRAVRGRYAPRAVVLRQGGGAEGKALEALAPFTARLTPLHGRAAAYVCEGFACHLPVTEPAALEQQLAYAAP